MSDGFASIDIILFAMLAAYLVFQLRRVLGRRTGNERRVDPFAAPEEADKHARDERGDNVVALPERGRADDVDLDADEEEPETLAAGLMRLKRADPSFDEKSLRGARQRSNTSSARSPTGTRTGCARFSARHSSVASRRRFSGVTKPASRWRPLCRASAPPM